MTERGRAMARRIYVPDVRGHDSYLRMTWHAEQRVVVVSQWDGPVCTAATRLDVADTPEIISFLAGTLGDAATVRPAETVEVTTSPEPWWRRWTARWRRPQAKVVAMPEPQQHLRWHRDTAG